MQQGGAQGGSDGVSSRCWVVEVRAGRESLLVGGSNIAPLLGIASHRCHALARSHVEADTSSSEAQRPSGAHNLKLKDSVHSRGSLGTLPDG
jgi:hypothetical protein